MVGSPVLLEFVPHAGVMAPYMRCFCDTCDPPTWARVAHPTRCHVFGLPPSQQLAVAASVDGVAAGALAVTEGHPLSTTGRTFILAVTPTRVVANTTVFVRPSYFSEGEWHAFDPPGVYLPVAGTPAAKYSRLMCASPSLRNGFVLRGARISCVLTPAAMEGPVRATRDTFAIVASGHSVDTKISVALHNVDTVWEFSVVAASHATVSGISIEVTERLTRTHVTGSPVRYHLTDTEPPMWLSLPGVEDVSRTSATVSLAVDEASQVYVGRNMRRYHPAVSHAAVHVASGSFGL